MRRSFIAFRNTFPDLTIAINDQIAEDNKVVIIHTMRGTNAIPMMVIPPGQLMTFVGIDVWQIINGKIANYFGLSQPAPNTP